MIWLECEMNKFTRCEADTFPVGKPVVKQADLFVITLLGIQYAERCYTNI